MEEKQQLFLCSKIADILEHIKRKMMEQIEKITK